jgi:hypothetical protein
MNIPETVKALGWEPAPSWAQNSKAEDLYAEGRERMFKKYDHAVLKMSQTQASSSDQLEILVQVANKLGLYDAADVLKKTFDL